MPARLIVLRAIVIYHIISSLSAHYIYTTIVQYLELNIGQFPIKLVRSSSPSAFHLARSVNLRLQQLVSPIPLADPTDVYDPYRPAFRNHTLSPTTNLSLATPPGELIVDRLALDDSTHPFLPQAQNRHIRARLTCTPP
ncbi:hypothetical protein F4778DRAFT_493162 [Xylariomycetidae sp. FL2044]|nr:hypothetical protein F4778DRAFT_493162 [Xylariomycetidae sp. FL2044]